MAQLVVRNLEGEVKTRLQKRAAKHHRSMEEEIREILREAANREPSFSGGLGTEIASLFKDIGLDERIPELRGQKLRRLGLKR